MYSGEGLDKQTSTQTHTERHSRRGPPSLPPLPLASTGYLKKRGIFGTRGKLQSIVCLAVSGNRVISGTVGGFLYLWVGRNCAKAVKGHMVRYTHMRHTFGHNGAVLQGRP